MEVRNIFKKHNQNMKNSKKIQPLKVFKKLTPKWQRGQKLSLQSFKSSSKCCKFCIQAPNSIRLFGKVVFSLLVCMVKSWDQSKMYWFFGSQSKFITSIWVHQTAF